MQRDFSVVPAEWDFGCWKIARSLLCTFGSFSFDCQQPIRDDEFCANENFWTSKKFRNSIALKK